EDVLDHERASEEARDIKSNERHERKHGVLERVAHDGATLRETLGCGRPHVILANNLEHLGADIPRPACEAYERQGDRRENEVLVSIPESTTGAQVMRTRDREGRETP